jgi:hypothetical protein
MKTYTQFVYLFTVEQVSTAVTSSSLSVRYPALTSKREIGYHDQISVVLLSLPMQNERHSLQVHGHLQSSYPH